ncbi:MAG: hypothetical protein PW845_09430 [Pseudomonas sp.]|uniref:hypothetical protein n=1 Tax=Pseudomonas abieticivorans TaxID=2931382 RepID=UPI0020C10F66|nr:hypothetical protein [Pseudomonas sp. PIA16]MDE1165593.1 hypothetical protein [Pseudomonas sp.]
MKKILGTLAEQGAYTGGFFVTQVIAARVLSLADFALFSAMYSSVILLSIIHACTTADILLMFGRRGQALELRSLLNILYPVAVLAVLATGYFAITTGRELTVVLLPFFFMAFVMYWTLRSLAILNRKTFGLLVPPVLQVAVLSTLLLYPAIASLDLIVALIALCLGSPALYFWRRLGRGEPYAIEPRAWIGFSISNSAAQVVLWAMTHGVVIFLLAGGDTAGSAYFRVVMTLILPAQYFGIALSNHYLPRLMKLRGGDRTAYYRQCAQLAVLGVGASALYGALLMLGGDAIPRLIFGQAFSGIGLSPLAILPVSLAVIQSGRTILKSSGFNHYVLLAMLVGLAGFTLHFIDHQHTLTTGAMLLGVNLTAASIVLVVLVTIVLSRFNSAEVRA